MFMNALSLLRKWKEVALLYMKRLNLTYWTHVLQNWVKNVTERRTLNFSHN